MSYDSSFKEVLADAKTIPEVLIIMSKYWSFHDYDLITPIVEQYKKHLLSLYTSYRERLNKFFQEFGERRICECPQDLFEDQYQYDSVLIVKTGMSVNDKLKELSGFVKEVKGIFGSKVLQLLKVVHEDTVQLNFRTSPQKKEEEVQLSEEQQLMLQSLKVLSIIFKEQLLYDFTSMGKAALLPGDVVVHCDKGKKDESYAIY